MARLWQAIKANQPGRARGAFFPEAAYAQVKAIADPQSDFKDRLWHEFTLDVAAAHALLGAAAGLTAVHVPQSAVHWVPPGACYNRIGYYEVPNSRVVYSSGGQTRSFGIASMISWRGVWYVVHLGAVSRASDAGTVDEPSDGSGVSTPSSTC